MLGSSVVATEEDWSYWIKRDHQYSVELHIIIALRFVMTHCPGNWTGGRGRGKPKIGGMAPCPPPWHRPWWWWWEFNYKQRTNLIAWKCRVHVLEKPLLISPFCWTVSEHSLWYDGTRHVRPIRHFESARHFRIEFELGCPIRIWIESRSFAGP